MRDIDKFLDIYYNDENIYDAHQSNVLPGPLTLNPGDFIEEQNLYWSVRSVIAEFSDGPIGFPIQKLILGKEAFDWFDSEKNADFISYILTRKLSDYLQGTRAHVELVDGKPL